MRISKIAIVAITCILAYTNDIIADQHGYLSAVILIASIYLFYKVATDDSKECEIEMLDKEVATGSTVQVGTYPRCNPYTRIIKKAH